MGNLQNANIIISVRNVEINRKGNVQITSTNIMENIIKILLKEGFIISGRKSLLETVNYEALNDGEGPMVVPHPIKPFWKPRIVGSSDGLVCLALAIFLYIT
ncbi:hypothetical protein ACJRO7_031718 [Eucalyptus globulus]|uniref:Uncharacterized protein n=1 Tax=Eucalyptus globulus TaxID=34317 RepID=A0ABD3JLZ6_EUCGL